MFGKGYNYKAFERNRLLKDMAASKIGNTPSAGDRAPAFEARTLDGEKIRLKDFRGEKNVVLTFGSATCPATAASLPELNELYHDRDNDVEFLFVYVREAHPGERIPAHEDMGDKIRAAERLRQQEDVDIPIVMDEWDGRIHRKYGKLPNPSFIIDKSGRIAFRSLYTRPKVIAKALDELLTVQHERGEDHAIVLGGEDLSLPSLQVMLRAHRALERGGERAMATFRRELGVPGRVVLTTSRLAQPILENPGKTVAAIATAALVIGAGIWGGLLLRRKRLGTYRSPYESRRFQRHTGWGGEYEAVGI